MIFTLKKGKSVPLKAQKGPEGSRKLRFPDFVTSQDGGRLSALRTGRLYPPGNTPGTHFCYKLSRPQGHSAIGRILCQWKITLTPAGIEPATFRFVAQHLNHCATAGPSSSMYQMIKKKDMFVHYEQSFHRSVIFCTVLFNSAVCSQTPFSLCSF